MVIGLCFTQYTNYEKKKTISGYTAKEWNNDQNAKLIITNQDGDETIFNTYYVGGEPAFPPLEMNGVDWEIRE
jgi:hypothetical protein